MLRCKQFSQRPDVIGQSAFHRGCDPQRLVYPAKVVVCEVQGTRSFQVVQLLREAIGQSSKSADRHSHSQVLPLHVTGGYMAQIRSSVTYFNYGLYHRGRRVSSRRVVLPVIAVQLYQLGKIGLTSEYVLHSLAVEVESIGRDLKAMLHCDSVTKRCEEL